MIFDYLVDVIQGDHAILLEYGLLLLPFSDRRRVLLVTTSFWCLRYSSSDLIQIQESRLTVYKRDHDHAVIVLELCMLIIVCSG